MLVLVLVEAMGFAYVLAGWMNMDASTNDRHLLAAATALLLAVASAFLAEVAGHSLHHNSLIAGRVTGGKGKSPQNAPVPSRQTRPSIWKTPSRTLTNLTTSSCWHA
ncbi:hypothetical protein [Aeromonas caviae]|uniref:hypothetical protein n=1 Tax=Aeromonas caviae TaxID=648 RepID=UPI001F4E22DD|nr:hypothetical protein [Aeromonas caviae]